MIDTCCVAHNCAELFEYENFEQEKFPSLGRNSNKNRNRKENRLETVEEAETFLSLPYTVSRDFHSRHKPLFNRAFNYYRDTHHVWYESDKHHSGRFC